MGFATKGDFMEQSLSAVKKSTLFDNITEENIKKLFNCISASEKSFQRGSFVFRAYDEVRFVYLILSGSIHIISEDFWGNQSIIETMLEGTLFGEAYVFAERESQLVSVVAAEDSVILVMDPIKLFESCPNKCACHSQLIRNALGIVSNKIVRLTEKLEHIMFRTIREKLLSYLSKFARREKSNSFFIPYTRQQLADYLCVDRSALSHELSRLQKQGIIRYKKSYFELLVDHNEIL